MIGAGVTVPDGRFDYVMGLLVDGGMVPDEDFMPTGGNELVIRPEAWDRLDGDTQAEVARFAVGVDVVPQPPGGDDGGALPDAGSVTPAPAGNHQAPPRVGKGSGRAAWAEYATSIGKSVTPALNRDEIIELVEAST